MTVEPFSATAPLKSVKGTAAKPGITFVGDGNTGIFSPNADQIAVTTGGTQRLLIGADGTITLTNNFSLPLGSAANPSLFFGTDSNTGVYSPGADQVAISTGGTGRLFINSSGQVGIGTSSQNRALVISSADSEQLILSSTSGSLAGIFFNPNGTTYTPFFGATSNDLVAQTQGLERLRITSDGKLGLGTSSPSEVLHVVGNTRLGNNATNPTLTVVSSNTGNPGANTRVGTIKFAANANNVSDITAERNCGITATTGSDERLTNLDFYTSTVGGGSPRVRIDSSGNVGIGTTSPGAKLNVSDTNAVIAAFGRTGTTGSLIALNDSVSSAGIGCSSGALTFGANGYDTERARIDSSGRLLVGTSTARTINASHTGQIQLEGTNFASSTMSIIANSNDAAGSYLFFGKSRGTTIGSNTIVQDGDTLGQIDFFGSDGVGDFSGGARIAAIVDGTPGSGDLPARLVFSTTADGASSPTERLLIDSAGQIEAGSLGTAAAPVWSFLNDPNTGLYSPGADQVAISTNGTGRLFVGSNGRVGVNTSSAPSLFVVSKAGVEGIEIEPGDTSGVNLTRHYNRSTDAFVTSSIYASNHIFYTGATEAMRLDSSGRLGLGVSDPVEELVVAGATANIGIYNTTAGSTASPSYSRLNFYGYLQTTLWNVASISAGNSASNTYGGILQFATNTVGGTHTTALTIDSSQRVGIGTTSVTGKLEISSATAYSPGNAFNDGCVLVGNSNSKLAFSYDSTNEANITALEPSVAWRRLTLNAGDTVIKTTGNEAARFSGGKLLVGTSTALSGPYWTDAARLQVAGQFGVGQFSSFVNTDSGAGLVFQKSRNTSVGGNTIVQSGDILMDVSIEGNDGTGFKQAAAIRAFVDGTPGANDMPGRLVFSTTADGASSPTERLLIDSAGQIEAGSLGTAAAPVWSFLNDTNTGIYSPGADQVAISTNGTGRLFVDANGNLTNTRAIATAYSATNAATWTNGLSLYNSSTPGTGVSSFINFTGNSNVNSVFGVTQAGSSYGDFVWASFNGSFSERMRLTAGGALGLGTSSPSEILHASSTGDVKAKVATTSTGAGANAGVSLDATTEGHWLIQTGNAVSDGLRFYDVQASAERVRIDSSGNVGVGTTSPGRKLSIADSVAPTLGFYRGSTEDGLISSEAAGLAIQTFNNTPIQFSVVSGSSGFSERARIDSSGRLGLGTSSPGEALDVLGKARIQPNTGATNTGDQSVVVVGAITTGAYSSTYGAGLQFQITNSGGGYSGPRIVSRLNADNNTANLVFQSRNYGFTDAMTLDSSGRLGIGNTGPRSALDVTGNIFASGGSQIQITGSAGSTGLQLIGQDSAESLIGTMSAQALAFRTNSSERARIDSSGRLLVGTSSARFYASLGFARFQVEGTSFADSSIGLTNNQATVDGAYLVFNKTRGTSVGSTTAVNNNDLLGSIWFQGSDGTSTVRGAVIEAAVDGTPGVSDMPGRLVFSTTADGAASPTERMRLDSSGRLGLGTSSPGALLEANGGDIWMVGANGRIYLQNGNTSGGAKIGVRGTSATSNGYLAFETNDVEFARFDSSGRLGIGTTSPGAALDVVGGSAANLNAPAVFIENNKFLTWKNTTGTWAAGASATSGNDFLLAAANNLTFGSGSSATERARIDSSGRLLVGTSTARSNFFNTVVSPQIQLEGTGDFDRQSAIISSSSTAAFGAVQILAHQKSGSIGGNTLVANNDSLGIISFQGSDGTQFVEAARIESWVDGTPGSDDMPGRLVFSTTADGAINPTEHMRIDSAGDVTLTMTPVAGITNTSGNKLIFKGVQLNGQSNNMASIYGVGGSSWGGDLVFTTKPNDGNPGSSPTERMRIDSSGRLGIGTTSPSALLDCQVDTNSKIKLTTSSSETPAIAFNSNGVADVARLIAAESNGGGILIAQTKTTGGVITERARIDSSGRLLVGTSSTSEVSRAVFQGNSASSTGTSIVKLTLGNASPGSTDEFGKIQFADSSHVNAAQIAGLRDGGTWNSGSRPSALTFSTTADGASSPTERMRITNAGTVLISCTSFPSTTVKGIGIADNGGFGYFIRSATSITTSYSHIDFVNPNGIVGSISTNASATAYNTSSDYRLKEDWQPITGAFNRLQQLKPVNFAWKIDGSRVDGFLAHEAQEVVPECVTGEKDAVDDDGNPIYQGIDQSKLVPLLTAALQEALQKIEDLEGRLTAAGL